MAVPSPIEIPGYLLLALVAVPVGRTYIGLFRRTRERFARLTLHPALRPMLGGLGVGAIGLALPQVYGTGWGYLQEALDGKLLAGAMLWILGAKMLATCLTIGSGGSGGIFGPTLFMGGMLGGVVGLAGHALAPGLFSDPRAYVLVGMASFFAGVASAPIGAMLMVAEMSGGHELLPPLMLVSVVAIALMRGRSIYTNQVKDRFQSPAHVGDLTVNVLEEMTVADVFRPTTEIPSVGPATGFQALRDQLLASRDATIPVLDPEGKLVGLLTAEQIRPVMDDHQLDSFVVAGDICAPAVWLLRDDDLYRAHGLFRATGCPQIPVLEAASGAGPGRILGMLDYRDMMRAYERELRRRREH
jgi:CIC family chloride channel protein